MEMVSVSRSTRTEAVKSGGVPVAPAKKQIKLVEKRSLKKSEYKKEGITRKSVNYSMESSFEILLSLGVFGLALLLSDPRFTLSLFQGLD